MSKSFATAVLTALLGVWMLSLSGCGWQLQGTARLPESMRAIRVETKDAYSDFSRELRERLSAAGADVQGLGIDAKRGADPSRVIVNIHLDESGQRVLSVSSRNTPEEYEVYYRIEYSVQVGNAEVIARQPLELTTPYSYDPRAVLAKQREQFGLQQALARELAGLVMRRLGSVNGDAAARAAVHAGRPG
ncbi:MAG TPA: LPS assembly lipoprotein LptE [Steroidobacteraceae bacterium]|nr:LPS assembly lipoprotein LptE [Steroidobacteraceae bacterium]